MLPLLFSIIVLLWVTGFDILYSIQDEEFDKEESLRSIPAVYGKKSARVISAIIHLAVVLFVIKTGYALDTGFYYWIGAGLFISLLILQHILINTNNPKRINFAFATLNGLSSLVFATFNVISFYW